MMLARAGRGRDERAAQGDGRHEDQEQSRQDRRGVNERRCGIPLLRPCIPLLHAVAFHDLSRHGMSARMHAVLRCKHRG